VNDAAPARGRASTVLVRFGGDGRPLKFAVAFVVLVAILTVPVNRLAAAGLLIVLPLVLLLRYQRRALVIVRPAGPLVVQGWWRRATVSPQQVVRADWQPGRDWAYLRLGLEGGVVTCFSVAIPTSPKARLPKGADWRRDVAALIDALRQAGVRPAALHGLHLDR
jgi:hypothetical protein